MSCSAHRFPCQGQPFGCLGKVLQALVSSFGIDPRSTGTPLQRGGPWHAVLSVYIKSQSARMGAMGMHARPQTIYPELCKPIIPRNNRRFGWRSPLLEQTCHSTRTKAVHQRAGQCQAFNKTALRSETTRKGVERGSSLRASVASTDGISAQANANLVPGGRDFFTCKAPFALSHISYLRLHTSFAASLSWLILVHTILLVCPSH